MDAARYFGTFRACFGIKDAIIINHVPVGCNWGAMLFATRSNQPDIRNVCSVMHEREIVFGGENALKEALINANKLYKNPLFIVLVGDVPSIIGDDVEGVVESVDIDKDVIVVEGAGYKGSMKDGYENALLKLAELLEEKEKIPKSVNLIGFCPDDFKVEADIKEIKRLLNDLGIRVNAVISNCTYEEFKNSPSAELNVVIGQGVEFAKYMEKEFGIPYIEVNYPYGIEGTKSFLKRICDKLNVDFDEDKYDIIEPFEKIYLFMHAIYGTPVSVVGDYHAKYMAEFLEEELGFDIEVLAYFGEDYEDRIRDSYTTVLFGSSFEKKLADELKIPLIRYVYPTFDNISIYDDAPFAGIRGAVYLTEKIINTIMEHNIK